MKIGNILNSIKPFIGRTAVKVKYNAPTIAVVTGVTAMVAGTVVACKKTPKAIEAVEHTKEQLEMIHDVHENGLATVNSELVEVEYTEKDYKQDLAIVYSCAIWSLAKIYALPVLLEVGGAALIFGANKIMNKRVATLGASYTALKKAYDAYRTRVADRYGEDEEHRIFYNLKAVEMTEEYKDENGKKKTKKTTVDVVDEGHEHYLGNFEGVACSPYARLFDKAHIADTSFWSDDPMYRLDYLENVEKWANRRLNNVGCVFLNEVYDRLGFARSQAGQHVGWWAGNPDGDGRISIGMKKFKGNEDFLNGFCDQILLDFNVDGDITHYLVMDKGAKKEVFDY